MNRRLRWILNGLVLPLSLGMATWFSSISRELQADDYTPPVLPEPEDPPPENPAPSEPVHDADDPATPPTQDFSSNLSASLDPSAVERIHREKIMTRTVRCIRNCVDPLAWAGFIDLAYEKQSIAADLAGGLAAQRSEDRVLTAGVDRRFGPHLLGFSLGASDGSGKVDFDTATVGGRQAVLDIDRDKLSAGLYYGLALPYNLNLGAQLMASDYDYDTHWFDPYLSTDDAAQYDGEGYTGSLSLSAIVPLRAGGRQILFQPSASYQHVRSRTGAYTSEQSVAFDARRQRSDELELAVRWRLPLVVGASAVLPYGGFAYTRLDREIHGQSRDLPSVSLQSRYELLEGLVGLTVQKGNLSGNLSYKQTIGSDELERERYQLTVRARF